MAGTANIRDRTCVGLSILYVFIIITYGIALPLAPMISNGVISSLVPIVYYCVLFSISIVFLLYVHCFLLKDLGKTQQERSKKVNHPLVYSVSKDYAKNSYAETGDVKPDNRLRNTTSEEDDSETSPESEERSHEVCEQAFRGPSSIPMVTNFHHGEGSYPNFYLRIGAVVFGSGIMLYSGLSIAQLAHDVTCGTADHRGYGFIIVDVLQFIFTFFQLYFVFRHNKISINVHKVFARFGLMHMVATNACTWFLIMIRETEEGFKHLRDHATDTTVAPGHANSTDPCLTNVMQPIVESLQPYLFPCIIEYSLIMAASIYQMCQNIGLHERILLHKAVSGVKKEDDWSDEHLPLTCAKSYHGLFTGIAFIILTVIGIVLYNVLYFKNHLREGAAILYFSVEFTILCVLLLATVIVWRMVQKLAFHVDTLKGLDAMLLIISLVGIYLFDAFCIVHAAYGQILYQLIVGILRPLLSSVQSTVQVLFIFDGNHRFTNTLELSKQKPGRELVIFSLMLNMSLWALYTFQARTMFNDALFNNLYNKSAWIVLTHIAIPLIIFFRFHSTTCLYEIWKQAFAKQKQHHK